MSRPQGAAGPAGRPVHYEIRVRGVLDRHWSGWFEGLQVSRDAPGQTLIAGPVADQAALHGLLAKVRDLGLPLLSVQRISPGREPSPAGLAPGAHQTTAARGRRGAGRAPDSTVDDRNVWDCDWRLVVMRWRTLGRIAATVFLALVVTGAVAAVGIAGATGEIYTARDPSAPPARVDALAAPVHDPGKPTAVVVLASEGANAADVLAPYEVLASTGAFNLYTVAPQRQPVPLTGGLDLVPDLSFGQLDQRLPTGPEVIVVPQLSHLPSGLPPSVAVIVQWLQRQRAQGDPLLVGVCVGAEVLAKAGLLDGRPATSHWLGLIGQRRNYPQVRWTDGVRYVDDGDVITTAGVLSGVDGALRVVERLVGPAAAAQAAQAVHWPAYSPGGPAPIQRSRPAPPDVVAVLSAGYRWDRPTMGSCSPTGSGRPSWPRRSGPTPSCRTWPARWR